MYMFKGFIILSFYFLFVWKFFQVELVIVCIKEEIVVFENGNEYLFDVIVFVIGFRSMVCEWLEVSNVFR